MLQLFQKIYSSDLYSCSRKYPPSPPTENIGNSRGVGLKGSVNSRGGGEVGGRIGNNMFIFFQTGSMIPIILFNFRLFAFSFSSREENGTK